MSALCPSCGQPCMSSSALSAPVSGEAVAWGGEIVAWGCFEGDKLEENLVYHSKLKAEAASQAFGTGIHLTVEPLCRAAHPKPAGEGVEAMREALEALVTAVRFADPPVEFNRVLCHEARVPVEFVANAERALSTLSGGLGSRPAAQAVPGCDAAKGAGHD